MDGLILAIRKRMDAGTGSVLPGAEIVVLLRSLAALRQLSEKAEASLSELGTQGHALHHLQGLAKDYPAVAWCMFTFLRAQPSGQPPAEIGQSAAGHNALGQYVSDPDSKPDLVDKFLEVLRNVDELDLVLTILNSYEAGRPFALACIAKLITTQELKDLLSASYLIESYTLLEEGLDEDSYSALLAQAVKETEILTALQEMDFVTEDAGLYADLLSATGTSDPGFRNWCVRGIRGCDRPTWASQLDEEGSLIDLLVLLLGRGVDVVLELAFQDALEEHASRISKGEVTLSEHADDWPLLFPALAEESKENLGLKLLDLVLGVHGSVNGALFAAYGSLIGSPKVLGKRSEVPLYVFAPLVTEGNELGLSWLLELLQSDSKLLDKFQRAGVREFRDRIRDAMPEADGDPDAVGTLILSIAKILGIKPSRKSKSET